MSTTSSGITLDSLDPARMPVHVAVILDGNGRWASARGLSRSEGHREGARNLDRLLDFIVTLNIPNISLYAFSTENWKRPEGEVSTIWKLLNHYFQGRLDTCKEQGIRLKVSGDISHLPFASRKALELAEKQTAGGEKLTANFCINYGSRAEIVHAAHEILLERLNLQKEGRRKEAEAPISEEELEHHLYTHPLPPVDLLIRPGGESRISNFLLWQSAYAEIYVTEVLWPDFKEENLLEALAWFQSRDRRFGGLSPSEQ